MARILSQVTLYQGWKFQADFNHLKWWKSIDDKNAYFDNLPRSYQFANSYIRLEDQIRWKGYPEDVEAYTYIKVQNPVKRDGSSVFGEFTTWYGYVTNYTYVNDSVVLIDWMVDPYTTFIYNGLELPTTVQVDRTNAVGWQLGASGKLRPDYRLSQLQNEGSANEGVLSASYGLNFNETTEAQTSGLMFLVIMTIPPTKKEGGFRSFNYITPYDMYVVPLYNGNTMPYDIGPSQQGGFSSTVNVNSRAIFNVIRNSDSEIFQGTDNQVVAAMLFNDIGIGIHLDSTNHVYLGNANGSSYSADKASVSAGGTTIDFIHFSYINPHSNAGQDVGDAVEILKLAQTVSKDQLDPMLLFSPFSHMEINDGRGQVSQFNLGQLGPYIGFGNSTTLSPVRYGMAGQNNNTRVFFKNISNVSTSNLDVMNLRTNSDFGIVENADNSVPIINDSQKMFWEGNKNQVQQSRKSAAMSKTNNGIANRTTLQNLKNSQSTSRENLSASQKVASQQQFMQAAVNTGTGALSGLMGGGVFGMLGGAVGGIATGMMQNAMLGQNQALQSANQNRSLNTEAGNARNSVDASNKIASNNYAMAISGINAGLSDMNNHSDSLAMQGDSSAFDFGYQNTFETLDVYTQPLATAYALSAVWRRIGYSMHGMAFSNSTSEGTLKGMIEARTNWTYIKTIGLQVYGDMPEKYREQIRNIFDNGATFWIKDGAELDYTQPNYLVSVEDQMKSEGLTQ